MVVVRVVVVRVVVVRTQNFLSPATRVSRTRGSVARVSATNAKFSKSIRACNWYEHKIFKVQPRVVELRVVVVRVVVVRTQNFLCQGARGSGTIVKYLSPAARGSGTRGSGTNAKFSKSRRAW